MEELEKQKIFLSKIRNDKVFAISQHRKMWIWIAQQYAKCRKETVGHLKREYIKKYCFDADVFCFCFCCEYVLCNKKRHIERCSNCILKWSENSCINEDSEYERLVDAVNILCDSQIPGIGFLKSPYFKSKRQNALAKELIKQGRKCAKLAYKISQLPENGME